MQKFELLGIFAGLVVMAVVVILSWPTKRAQPSAHQQIIVSDQQIVASD